LKVPGAPGRTYVCRSNALEELAVPATRARPAALTSARYKEPSMNQQNPNQTPRKPGQQQQQGGGQKPGQQQQEQNKPGQQGGQDREQP
jgi:hypothetical protein